MMPFRRRTALAPGFLAFVFASGLLSVPVGVHGADRTVVGELFSADG